jgi:hypothetical protein
VVKPDSAAFDFPQVAFFQNELFSSGKVLGENFFGRWNWMRFVRNLTVAEIGGT